MKILFICNQNQNRSRTAEEIFKNEFEVKSAGLYNKNPVTENDLSWADLIIVMEEQQRIEIAKRFPKQYLQKRILSLNIPDSYYYMQPELKKVIRKEFNELVNPLFE